MTTIEFIKKHQMDEDDKCECLILPDGSVEEPFPSHINRLMEIAGKDASWINVRMEKSMEPLFWVVEYTGCMSVWQTRVVSPARPTQGQLETLEELRDAAMLAPKYLMQKADRAYTESACRARTLTADKA